MFCALFIFSVIATSPVLTAVGAERGNISTFCKLNKHPSVEYRCLNGGDAAEGTRPCSDEEPSGTIVRPECKAPNYYLPYPPNIMRCVEGSWDHVTICDPECGRVKPEGEQLRKRREIEGRRGQLPWHASIYKKTTTPYQPACGGTLVSSNVVISVAHCFWDHVAEARQPAADYAVAVGKLYRPWDDPRDANAQKADIREIKIPGRFRGGAASFQDDIAVLLLATSFEFKAFVQPVCVDFDVVFDRRQLQSGKLGKIASWALTDENNSNVLKTVDLPFVPALECILSTPSGFREFITSDKFCAGYKNGSALCRGDSGAGFAFPVNKQGIERHYLRGIMSTAPNTGELCSEFTVITFTQVTKQEYFLKEYL